MGPDSKVYYYCFYPSNPPVQLGTATQPKIYWLALYAQPSHGTANLFGWKTTALRQFDISVHASWPGVPPTGGWIPTISPNNQPLDLAFKITTDTNQPPPPPCCPETNGVKFLQPPNVINGQDVLASRDMTLADDFRCTDTGPISDIHIWGSWLRDTVGTNATFTLGIWSDIPAVTNATGRYRSSPGNVLWSQTFGPGEYAQCFYTNVNETFYDPSVPAILGPDSNIFYYCFFPTNRFVQQGTSAKPTNYWLSVNVQPPAGAQPLFGWHTSATSYNDDAVWFKGPVLPFVPPPAAWNEMFDLQGRSLNLAFKITTDTNGCPPMAVTCPAAKTVECGTPWSFDLPTVVDPCCGTNYTITVVNTSTSGVCPQTITRTWAINDCLGLAANCSQTVTVLDTTPPVITCGTNKTV